jgi:hypothetical protein
MQHITQLTKMQKLQRKLSIVVNVTKLLLEKYGEGVKEDSPVELYKN